MGLLDLFKKSKPDTVEEAHHEVEAVKQQLMQANENLFHVYQQLDHRLMEEREGRILLRPYTQRALPPITINEHFEAMGISRWCAVNVPEAKAALGGLRAYVIGSSPSINVLDEDTRVEEFIEKLIDKNDLLTFISDAFYAEARDGECFVELVPDGGIPKLRLIDPATVRPPSDDTIADRRQWEFGILTEPDVGQFIPKIKGYAVFSRDGTKHRKLTPHFLFHGKYHETMHKRSMPIFTSCLQALLKIPELRRAGMAGAIATESIAYFREHEYGDADSINAIRNFRDGIGGDIWQKPIPVQLTGPGEVVDIPTSLKVSQPPQKDGKNFEIQLRAAIQEISAACQLPTWIVGGDPAPGSYASSLTAESPFLRNIEYLQFRTIEFWKRIIIACIELAQSEGILPSGIEPEIDITLAESLVHNILAQSQAYEILYRNRAISRKTFTSSMGFNPQEEELNMRTEEELPPIGETQYDTGEKTKTDSGQMRPENT